MKSGGNIVFILSNVNKFPYGHAGLMSNTGNDALQLCLILLNFVANGYSLDNMTFVTAKGGKAPLEPRTLNKVLGYEELKNILTKVDELLGNTISFADLKLMNEKIIAVVIPGGYGLMFDLIYSTPCADLLAKILTTSSAPVIALGNGAILLTGVMVDDPDKTLNHAVIGREMTCISVMEEKMIGKHVPFYSQRLLERLKVDYKSSIVPWMSHVCVDGSIVTGQNVFSVKKAVEEGVKIIKTI